jgi:phosphohistidine phosphatase
MKSLLLMRHAKSSWKDDDLADHKRPLKKRGRRDAAEMAKIIKKKNLVPDLVLSSSAVRAEQTTEIFTEKLQFKGEIEVLDVFYMAEPETIIEKLNTVSDEINRVIVIGHNPGLESLVQQLGDKIDSLPTSAIAVIELPIDSWKELNHESTGKLSKFFLPEKDSK